MTALNNTLSALLTLSMTAATAFAAPKIHVFESDAGGFNTKSFFYDNGEEVVAIDTQFTPELTRKSIEFLRTKTKNPITHVVITHPNPDKFNGIPVMKKLGAKVIASDATKAAMAGVHAYKKYYFVNMAKMFTEATYPKLELPGPTFKREMKLQLKNGEELRLLELGRPGVSSNQTVVEIPAVKALFVGDLVHHKAHAWLEGGIVNGKPTPTVKSWINVLKDLKKNFAGSVVFGGRGEKAPISQAVNAQVKYLEVMDQLVNEYVKELNGQTPNFVELEKRAQKEFPDYALSYMIQYGAYGLLNSKL